jgi:hypothetical protein
LCSVRDQFGADLRFNATIDLSSGSVEIAAVGVSIAIFNQVSKVCIYPLVSVTTSFVAEEDAIISKYLEENSSKDLEKASAVHSETCNVPASGTKFLQKYLLSHILIVN